MKCNSNTLLHDVPKRARMDKSTAVKIEFNISDDSKYG